MNDTYHIYPNILTDRLEQIVETHGAVVSVFTLFIIPFLPLKQPDL